MTRILDFGGGSTGNTPTTVTVPSPGVAVGETIVVAVGVLNGSLVTNPATTITDSGGNEYAVVTTAQMTGSTTGVLLAYSVATHALASGATITFTPGNDPSRTAVSVQVFDEEVTSRGTSDSGVAETATATLTAGSPSSTDTAALYVAAWCLVNSGRTFTPGAGWTAGTKQVSTNGSGDRAIVVQSRYGDGTLTTPATLNSSGTWIGVSIGLGLDEAPPLSDELTGSAIIGGAKKTVVQSSVIVGGVKKSIAQTSVIVGGIKKPIPS